MTVSLDTRFLPEGPAVMRLNAPRANALVPELLERIDTALNVAVSQSASSIVISGGSNFCSGGDLEEFYRAINNGRVVEYARTLVSALQALVLKLISMPIIVVVAARGAVTGGGAGMLFASDFAVASEDTFVQPYYSEVGFAPDGGWLAVLPERIGRARALAWLSANRRVKPIELQKLNLLKKISSVQEAEASAISLLSSNDLKILRERKRSIWTTQKLHRVARALEDEKSAFLQQVERPETHRSLSAFLGRMKGQDRV